jgi:ABC-type antimicrobial peptide transport system permease subunit
VRRITAVERLTGTLVGGLAAVALALSAVGVFGVAGYAVSSRRRELGVRLALGATSRRLEREVMRATLGRLGWAMALGLALALLAARAARPLLPAAASADPALIAATAATIAAVALLAGWIPARRVARIDPVEVIQREKR